MIRLWRIIVIETSAINLGCELEWVKFVKFQNIKDLDRRIRDRHINGESRHFWHQIETSCKSGDLLQRTNWYLPHHCSQVNSSTNFPIFWQRHAESSLWSLENIQRALQASSIVEQHLHQVNTANIQMNNSLLIISSPHSQLPELQKAIPFPPPAVLSVTIIHIWIFVWYRDVQATLPAQTTVIPSPQFSTILPQSTKILLPVLPETVPLIAQVPDVVKVKEDVKEIVEISQVLPGYARSYAGDYVPNEVSKYFSQEC